MAKELDFLASDDESGADAGVPAPRVPKRAPAGGARPAPPAGDEEEDDAAFIAAASQRHNVRAGVDVAKKASKSKQNKSVGGAVSGGGSFQSMGTCGATRQGC